MVTNFVLSVRIYSPCLDEYCFVMVRSLTGRLLVRWALGCVRFPHSALSGRGESLADGLARVLRDWGRASVDGVLLPHADVHDPTVSVLMAVTPCRD